jgi:hypothetical protein
LGVAIFALRSRGSLAVYRRRRRRARLNDRCFADTSQDPRSLSPSRGKKRTSKPSLTWSEAVDQALCFGWIDSRANTIDDERWQQRFSPRKPGQHLEQG